MSDTFKIDVLTPTKLIVERDVTEAIIPAQNGEVGVLRGHQDFVGLLGTGVLKLNIGSSTEYIVVSGGFFEVRAGELSILAQYAELPREIDAEQTAAELADLEKKHAVENSYLPEFAHLEHSIARARARLLATRLSSAR